MHILAINYFQKILHKIPFILISFFIVNLPVMAQSLVQRAYKLKKEEVREQDGWEVIPSESQIYVLFPDDETTTSTLQSQGGRYVFEVNDQVKQYGFYESNGSTIFFQDQKTNTIQIFVIRSNEPDETVFYQHDIQSNEERLYTFDAYQYDEQKANDHYVKYLFDLDEESLQSTFSNSLENFGISFFYAPSTSHRFIKFYSTGSGRRRSGLNPEIQDSINNIEIPRNGFQIGLVLTTKLNRFMLFESGLIFNQEGFQTSKIQSNTSNSYNLDYVFSYVDVPLAFRFYPLNKSLRGYIKLGLIPKFYRTNRIHRTNYDTENTVLSRQEDAFTDGQFVNLNMSVTAGIGLEYNLFSDAFIYVQPVYQSMIKAFASQQFVKRYLNNTSVQIGLKWNM